MAKIVFIGDTHWGVRNDNPIYYEYFEKFYKDLFAYIDEHGIKTIVQLGDLFDKRKSVNFLTLHMAKKIFLSECQSRGITVYIISGNHDCYYKSTNEVNSVRNIQLPNMVVVDSKPETIKIDGFDFDFYPWINEGIAKECYEYAATSKSTFAVGHFEFAKFRLHKFQIADTGADHTIFKNYRLVFSGHYHTISRKDNVLYTGTPYELDWADWADAKGFWAFDPGENKLDFIRNEHTLYEKIEYSDTEDMYYDFANAKDKFIKLVIKNKNNQYLFDSFFQNLLLAKPHDVNIVDDKITKSVEESMKSTVEFQTTTDMINHVIDNMNTQLDKNILKKMIAETYTEALELLKV
jgi:DNA repair exonuclease SbcCD nuclease subunit